jgi:hypothetical protein
VRTQITTVVNQGWIRPSLSPLGRTCALSAEEGWETTHVHRLPLNHHTVKHAYPMPRIEELLQKLRSYTVVSKLDLKSGYHQIRMAGSDAPKTTFVTLYGTFEFLVMPFGLSNAPAVFTLMVNDALGDLPYALLFMDDILVFSATISDHHRHLHEVLQRLRARNLYAAPDKCEFYRTASECLGYLVAPGISTQPQTSASSTALPRSA